MFSIIFKKLLNNYAKIYILLIDNVLLIIDVNVTF